MNLFIMIMVSFSIIIWINYYLTIHISISYIVHDLGILRVAQKIYVMSALQDGK